MIITFCGHRNLTEREEVTANLTLNINQLFLKAQKEQTALSFYCGGYGEFDKLSEKIVEEVRKTFPAVVCKKVFVTPYINPSYLKCSREAEGKFDEVVYPPIDNVPYKFAIIRRNEWMIDKADLVIAYVRFSFGGASRSLSYAIRRKKKIIMI